VQTNNDESTWRKKKKQLSNTNKQKMCELAKKAKHINFKNLVDKIHKLIVTQELKFNVNHHIKIGWNLFKSNHA
jgi:hypothetical protein